MRRTAGVAAAVGVVLVLFVLLLLKPKLSDISDVRKLVADERQRTQSLQIQLRQLQSAQQEAPATTARLAVFDRLLPSTPDLPSLIRQLQNAATASGMDLTSIAPSPPSTMDNTTGVSVVNVNLQVSGGFFRLESFLARLEDLQRVVEVTSMSVSPSTETSTGLQSLQSTITMKMYVVEPNARVTTTTARAAPRPTSTP